VLLLLLLQYGGHCRHQPADTPEQSIANALWQVDECNRVHHWLMLLAATHHLLRPDWLLLS
jgi:hypothetical protein